MYTEVLTKIIEPKRVEVREKWRILHIEELHGLYRSSNITRVIKFRMMKSVSNEEEGEEKCMQGFGGITLGKQNTGKT